MLLMLVLMYQNVFSRFVLFCLQIVFSTKTQHTDQSLNLVEFWHKSLENYDDWVPFTIFAVIRAFHPGHGLDPVPPSVICEMLVNGNQNPKPTLIFDLI